MDSVFVVVGEAVREAWSTLTTLSACMNLVLRLYEQETAAQHDWPNISRFLVPLSTRLNLANKT
jgi:hypothetical protein